MPSPPQMSTGAGGGQGNAIMQKRGLCREADNSACFRHFRNAAKKRRIIRESAHDPWVQNAIGYIRSWIEFRCGLRQPGRIVAVVHRGKVISEFAFGEASMATGEKLTPRHRFRIASHSKSSPRLRDHELREQRKLRLDDPVGLYVKGLHPQVAQTTIAQLLSHSAGLTRDGADAGQFADRGPI